MISNFVRGEVFCLAGWGFPTFILFPMEAMARALPLDRFVCALILHLDRGMS